MNASFFNKIHYVLCNSSSGIRDTGSRQAHASNQHTDRGTRGYVLRGRHYSGDGLQEAKAREVEETIGNRDRESCYRYALDEEGHSREATDERVP